MNDNRRPTGNGGFFGDEIFSSFHHQMSRDFNRMFHEMEEIMREFNHGNFGFIEGPEFRQPPAIQQAPADQPLRDRFLKSNKEESQTEPHNPGFGLREGNSIFDRFFYPGERFFNKQEFRDEDLDEKIQRDGFDKVAREDLLKKKESSPFSFHGQSYTYSRVQRPDGSIEETKRTRSSDGKEEKVVTRILGDKMHSITEKKNKDGTQETEEHFQNFDQNELDDFNRMWSNMPGATRSIQPGPSDNEKQSLTSKLFSWFKK